MQERNILIEKYVKGMKRNITEKKQMAISM